MELRLVKTVDGHARVADFRDAIDERTVCLVGSCPTYAHGIIDPIEELSELAREHRIGCHVDNCLGGILVSHSLGLDLWDFQLPGVTSISCDIHKYGGSVKGCSVIAYRTSTLRQRQYFIWEGIHLHHLSSKSSVNDRETSGIS